MSKINLFENKALQQHGVGFNLVNNVNNFNSFFLTKPLDQIEADQIEEILTDNFQEGSVEKNQMQQDAIRLKQLTSEIKAIGKQGTVLMGERVYQARELLKPYKHGAFTRWLESAFGTRKTGYNVLAYYEFYTALPQDDLREKFKKLQQKTAYILASREGTIEEKLDIISNYHNKSHNELIVLIQERFPNSASDRRANKCSLKKIIDLVRINLEKIKEKKSFLQESEKKELSKLKTMLDSVL